MKPIEQSEADQQLGQWDEPVSFTDHSLELRLEKSDTETEWLLPHPDKEVLLVARPRGFQLTSFYGYNTRQDFAIESAEIISVRLLPSFTVDARPGLSFKYIFLSAAVFFLLGISADKWPHLLLWILSGFTCGITLSLLFKRRYRQNLLFKLSEENKETILLFSIDKRQKQSCISFFSSFVKDKFSYSPPQTVIRNETNPQIQ